jgi:hypothetical protein
MRRPCSQLAVVVAGVALALFPARAGASTGYPAEIQSQLSLSYTPPCSICHGSDVDAGTGASTAFGSTMVEFGLMGGNNLPSLDGALQGLQGEKSIYITYLQDDVDPNNPSSSSSPIPGVTYGCFQAAEQGPSAGGLSVLLVGLAVLFLFLPRRLGRASEGPTPPGP